MARWPLLQADGLKGAIGYADGQFDDARYCVALVQTFTEAGGEAVNHARVVRSAAGCRRQNLRGGDRRPAHPARAQRFVRGFSSTAPGRSQTTFAQMANPGVEKRLRLSKGVHILLPLDERTTDAMVVPKTDDGRVIFAIPWLGRLLVGTTDDEVTHEDELVVKRSEAEYLLKQLNRFLSRPFAIEDIVGGFAGVRPLVSQGKGDKTKKLIREHEVEVDRESGLISVLGRQVDDLSRHGRRRRQRSAATAWAAGGRMHHPRQPSERLGRIQRRLSADAGGLLLHKRINSAASVGEVRYAGRSRARLWRHKSRTWHNPSSTGTRRFAPRLPMRRASKWQLRSTTCWSVAPACSSSVGRRRRRPLR